MQEKNKHMNDGDDFSQWVKQQLENHELPVDKDIWEGIEKKITPTPKRRVPVWYWLAGSVAALVALILLVRPYYNTQLNKNIAETNISQPDVPKSVAATPENPARKSGVPTEDEVIHPAAQAEATASAGLLNTQKVQPTKKSIPVKTVHVLTNTRESTENTSLIASTSASTSITNKQAVAIDNSEAVTTKEAGKNTEVKPNSTGKQLISSLPDLSDYPDAPADEPAKDKKKEYWLLAASLGSGSGLSSTGSGLFFETGAMSDAALVNSTSVKAEYAADIKEADYFNEIQHLPPVSFGLMVELPLSKCLSVESGLVYTYLESRFKRTTNPTGTGHLRLHYLGLPLYLKAKLWQDPTWSIYFSAGPMIEKGLQSIYSQGIDYTWSITHTDVHSRIEGLQWSLNTGLGVNYKIKKDLSVFFEPKLTYYLDNNQPMSARTEQPLVFGVNGGLRIEL